MRSIARGLGLGSAAMALTALTALAWPGTAGAAPAGTQSLYAPSSLVLSVTAGPDADTGTVLRAVTLVCAPRPGGTHPNPAAACRELRAAGSQLDPLAAPAADAVCTREWDPMTVTADGVWQGRRLNYTYTFANPCGLRNTAGALFGF
ncbi:alkaline protease inhibitor [Streptomyces sp. WM6373]|uniref:SSI family serine proteinase inhibitor n=1 Tax=Streptomyces TaxID=1883 RepID=UPI0006B0339B|nr:MULTISPECIES: SSI family serine proteinase inhibitor [unclassified Streptomyces]KOU43326.1 alkaline protease inhibitor [Streptomyces sp. WM6373]KOU72724.1 alkaline protease inhibitor [Streptomyces sp. XY66]KOU91086.1 alkaline protease inhibitor [Streptomyces sp. XY58]KOV12865.1 alkaline protease inhibitor [Streptomyces sp. XY37]KOV19891.1 alkaline protease inhibitor [Streptomyces sp. XY413]